MRPAWTRSRLGGDELSSLYRRCTSAVRTVQPTHADLVPIIPVTRGPRGGDGVLGWTVADREPKLPIKAPGSVPGDSPSQIRRRRILLIDDDLDILEVAALALRTAGFTVESCSDPFLAVTAAMAFQPDLVLLDAMMPALDGPAVFRRLRREAATNSIPVVFVTARVDSEALSDYRQLGAAAVIGKPFDPLAFVEALKVLAERLG
jgi:two-component system, OmpR family, response regulator